jgi:hypothetical protein
MKIVKKEKKNTTMKGIKSTKRKMIRREIRRQRKIESSIRRRKEWNKW